MLTVSKLPAADCIHSAYCWLYPRCLLLWVSPQCPLLAASTVLSAVCIHKVWCWLWPQCLRPTVSSVPAAGFNHSACYPLWRSTVLYDATKSDKHSKNSKSIKLPTERRILLLSHAGNYVYYGENYTVNPALLASSFVWQIQLSLLHISLFKVI